MTTADGRGDPAPPAPAERFRLMREGLWVTVGQVGGAVGRLAGIRMITGIVSPAVYGEIVLLQGLASLGTGLFCQPVLQASLRYYPDAVSRNKLGGAAKTRRKLACVEHAWNLPRVARRRCLVDDAAGSGNDLRRVRRCTGVVLALDVWRNHENALMNAARLQKDLAIWSTLDAFGRPVVGFFMAIVFGPRAVPVLVGYALAIAAGNAVFRSRTVRPREPAPAATTRYRSARSRISKTPSGCPRR